MDIKKTIRMGLTQVADGLMTPLEFVAYMQALMELWK